MIVNFPISDSAFPWYKLGMFFFYLGEKFMSALGWEGRSTW